VTACFAPDAQIKGIAFGGTREEYLGLQQESRNGYAATQHFVGNQLREIDGDTARTETYLIASHFWDAASWEPGPMAGVWLQEELRREPDGQWVITRRTSKQMWRRAGVDR
jgi:hypothetical protein